MQTTDQVETYYQQHPQSRGQGRRPPAWLVLACILGGMLIAAGLAFALAHGGSAGGIVPLVHHGYTQIFPDPHPLLHPVPAPGS